MPVAPAPRGNALAIIALVCSCLFFVPLVPLVGVVLGIIALVRADPGRRTLATVAIAVGAGVFLVIQATLSVIAVPAFLKYMRRAKASEARMEVSRLGTAVQMWELEHEGVALAPADWTPPGRACDEPGGRFRPDAAAWSRAPWSELGFRLERPHHYQYRITRDGNTYTVEARGDLDCDGEYSSFRRRVGNGRALPLETEHELE